MAGGEDSRAGARARKPNARALAVQQDRRVLDELIAASTRAAKERAALPFPPLFAEPKDLANAKILPYRTRKVGFPKAAFEGVVMWEVCDERRRILRERAKRERAELQRMEREAIYHMRFDGMMSVREIAEVTGRGERAIYRVLSRLPRDQKVKRHRLSLARRAMPGEWLL